jgi:NADH:flavin oxidoreductases, Old Yellow Enzyme family
MSNLMKIFTPIKIGNVEARNRIMMLPMGMGYSDDYYINEQNINFYRQRAEGGCGLITIGGNMVADLWGTTPQYASQKECLGIWDDKFIPGLMNLTKAIRDAGAKSICQLNICYEWRRDGTHPLEAVGPSAGVGGPFAIPLRELTIEEIELMVNHFGDGGRRAREAGYDIIELHLGIGYMLSRFISSNSNKRTDKYGGTLEKRCQIVLEVIEDIQKKAGADIPIMVRISADDYMPEGNRIEDTKKIIPILEKAGIVAFDIQAGFHECPQPLTNEFVPDGVNVPLSAEVKKVTKLPVAVGYRIDGVEQAEAIVREGKADFIGMGRALIADPDWAKKGSAGHPETIRRCLVCSRCLDSVFKGEDLRCSVNAEILSPLGKPQPAARKKKVVVIGAGPGGMEAARVAAIRGHDVILFDKGSRLGGSLVLASVLNHRMQRLVLWYKQELATLPIDIRLNTEVTPAMLDRMNPDEIVVSPGGEPIVPNVPGLNGDNVLTPFDLKSMVAGKAPKSGLLWWGASLGAKMFIGYPNLVSQVLSFHWPVKKRIAVIGGGFAGLEVAHSMMKGRDVTVIEESNKLGYDVGIINRNTLLNVMKEGGVKFEKQTKVKEITRNGVIIVKLDGSEGFVPADTVIVAIGLLENRKLYEQLSSRFKNVHLIGDGAGGREIRRTMEAVRDGYEVGMTI